MNRFVNFFKSSLRKRPVLTNTVVYMGFYSAAELSQQKYIKYNKPPPNDIDWKAAAEIVLVGSCLYPGSLYYWYKFLDKKLPGTCVKTVVAKVLIDQYTATTALLATFYFLLAVVHKKEDVFEYVKTRFWSTFKVSQMFWLPAQTLNFFFVPPQFRVVYVATASFIWINILCFKVREPL